MTSGTPGPPAGRSARRASDDHRVHLQYPRLRWPVSHSRRPVRAVRDRRHAPGPGQDAQADRQPRAERPRARGGRVMNGPVEEIRRLRGELAERDQQLAELRGLVQAHLEATDLADNSPERERAAYERGEEWGYRRGVEHALIARGDAHPARTAHDPQCPMRAVWVPYG